MPWRESVTPIFKIVAGWFALMGGSFAVVLAFVSATLAAEGREIKPGSWLNTLLFASIIAFVLSAGWVIVGLLRKIAALRAELDDLKIGLHKALVHERDDLVLGPESILSPTDKLGEARRQFSEVVKAAQRGESAALARLPAKGQTLLEISRRYYGSTLGFVQDAQLVERELLRLGAGPGTSPVKVPKPEG